ncbi:ankyrin repeat domain-containing protein [Legionella waltersii]|uniref:Ankyrin repeats (3 copies) n=1 Tax=Legionella waltersii TaxID=66969 RepID=A0A0W1APB3_9GAMM|nr:ankyrin repeat domain-containing protein [Legionella waltersii]KTD83075.1 Ankyrin repeats (3 copies) [Legionella waltersii]SNV08125.1 Predicted cysteine protease (OTU family) [Legionella waltersii]
MNPAPIKKTTLTKKDIISKFVELHSLVDNDELDKIKEIVQQAIHYKNTSPDFWSWSTEKALLQAFELAISLDRIETVEFFLKAGVRPSGIDIAIMRKSLPMVKLLVQYGCEIREESGQYYDSSLIGDNTAIECALKTLGSGDIVQYLLSEGASAKGCVHTKPKKPAESFLAYAAKKGDDATLEQLIRRLEYWCDILIIPSNKFWNKFSFIAGKLKGRDAIILIEGKQEIFFADWSERSLEKIVHKPKYDLYLQILFSDSPLKLASKRQLKWITKETGIRNDDLELALQLAISGAHRKYIKRIEPIKKTVSDYYKDKSKLQNQYPISNDKKEQSDRDDKIDKELSRTYNVENIKLLEKKIQEAGAKYRKIIGCLMDYVIGCDFPPEFLSFFTSLDDVSGINFIGVSIHGIPITREMLKEAGISGYEKALVTIQDWQNLSENSSPRLTELKRRVFDHPYYYEPGDNTDIDKNFNFVPLYIAAQIGDINTVKFRLTQGVNPNESILDQAQPIEYAVVNAHESIVRELINHPDFNEEKFKTAIELAKKHGHKTIEDLLKTSRNKSGDINSFDVAGNTELHYAIESGDIDEVRRLIDMGADVNLRGKLGYPLYICVGKSRFISEIGYYLKNELPPEFSLIQTEILRLLLEKGANPNIDANNSLLRYAESLEIIKILLPICKKNDITGYDPWEKKEERFPWYYTMLFNTFESPEWPGILKLLIEEKVDLNVISSSGKSLLHLVAETFPSVNQVYHSMEQTMRTILGVEDRALSRLEKSYSLRMMANKIAFLKPLKQLEFLLNHGVNPSLKNTKELEPVPHYILRKCDLSHIVNGYAQIFDLFISKGFGINEQDSNGYTLLHIASMRGDLDAIKYLMARKADVNIPDRWGRTPIYYAATGSPSRYHPKANPLTTEYLVHYCQAKVNVLDNEGLTPLQFSIEKYYEYGYPNLSYKDTDKQELRDSFLKAQDALWNEEYRRSCLLENAVGNNLTVHAASNEYTSKMKSYLSKFKTTIPIEILLSNTSLSKKDRKLFELYRDRISGQFMNIPVELNGRIYDLTTLTASHNNDPITGKPFGLSDIQPAEEVANEILELLKFFEITPNQPQQEMQSPSNVELVVTKHVKIENEKSSENSMHSLPKANELPEQLLTNIRQLGFEGYNEVEGDGNCLFYAIIDQCQQRNIPFGHLINSTTDKTAMTLELRLKIKEYITQHSDEYKDFFPIDQYQSLTDFINKVVIQKNYAGHMEITILAQLLVADIVIIRQDGVLTSIGNGNSTQTLYLGLVDHGSMSALNHYYSIIGKPNQPPLIENKIISSQTIQDHEDKVMSTSESGAGLGANNLQGLHGSVMKGNPHSMFAHPTSDHEKTQELRTGKFI